MDVSLFLMEERKTILVVDDDVMNRMIICSIFDTDHDVIEAGNGQEALERIRSINRRISAILLDYMMPEMDGLELLRILRMSHLVQDCPVFLITAEANSEVTRQAYELGVMDVISKPVVPFIVRRRIESVIELFENRKRLELTVNEQAERLLSQSERIIRLNYGMIEALTTAIEFRSGESGAHVRRIHDITLYMLENTILGDGFTGEEKTQIALASIMHDVGKIAVSDTILNKPGRLTEQEFEIMKTHTTEGARLLSQIPQLRELDAFKYAYDIALHHHERWDGGGYPEHLAGDEISVCAQIVSLADVYDALQSRRCYKEAYSNDRALEMIVTGQCGVFNPVLLEEFMRVEKALRPLVAGGGDE